MPAATALRPRLTGRPVIWDADEPAPDPALPPALAGRASRLARGLASIGVAAGDTVVVLCCPLHAEDRKVALAALAELGATPVVPVRWGSGVLTALSLRTPPPVHLACEEGVEAWRAARGRGVMIGDGEDVLWWRGLECRFAGAPAQGGPTSQLLAESSPASR